MRSWSVSNSSRSPTADEELAVEHAPLGQLLLDRRDDLGEVAGQRLGVAAGQLDLVAVAEHDAAEAVPLGLEAQAAVLGRVRDPLDRLRQHRLHGRHHGQVHGRTLAERPGGYAGHGDAGRYVAGDHGARPDDGAPRPPRLPVSICAPLPIRLPRRMIARRRPARSLPMVSPASMMHRRTEEAVLLDDGAGGQPAVRPASAPGRRPRRRGRWCSVADRGVGAQRGRPRGPARGRRRRRARPDLGAGVDDGCGCR